MSRERRDGWLYSGKDGHDETRHIRWPGGETWWERYDPSATGGQVRLVVAQHWQSAQTTCYCCSCGERVGSDPYCRNHGWVGTRICTEHPGGGDLADEDGCLLPTVQGERRRRAGRT